MPTEPVGDEEEFRFQSFAEKDHQEIAKGIAEIESSTTAVDRIAAAVCVSEWVIVAVCGVTPPPQQHYEVVGGVFDFLLRPTANPSMFWYVYVICVCDSCNHTKSNPNCWIPTWRP